VEVTNCFARTPSKGLEQAKAKLSLLLDAVASGDEVRINRKGINQWRTSGS
jgi:hypothetical protein